MHAFVPFQLEAVVTEWQVGQRQLQGNIRLAIDPGRGPGAKLLGIPTQLFGISILQDKPTGRCGCPCITRKPQFYLTRVMVPANADCRQDLPPVAAFKVTQGRFNRSTAVHVHTVQPQDLFEAVG